MKKKKSKLANKKIDLKSKLTMSQIKKLKSLLLDKREDLLKVVERKKRQDLPDHEIGEEIDTASQSIEKEILFELTNTEKIILDDIEAALRKIEKNKYGFCESCNKPIIFERLKAMPWVRYCINCQTKYESTRR